eukprot:COSAG01_NODE_542_length_15693_cov_13.246253_15_plen_115_part_00
MISEGFEAFSNDEVQRAYQAALQAQLGNQTAVDKYEWTAETVSKYIGNPDDGGAMSQPHVYQAAARSECRAPAVHGSHCLQPCSGWLALHGCWRLAAACNSAKLRSEFSDRSNL